MASLRGSLRLHDHVKAADLLPRARGADNLPQGHFDADDGSGNKQVVGDSYYSGALKLFPAEIVTFYNGFRQISSEKGELFLLFVVCLVTCILLRGFANAPRVGRWIDFNQIMSVLVAVIAFYLWVYASGAGPDWPESIKALNPYLAAVLQPDQLASAIFAAALGLLGPNFVPVDKNTPSAE